MMRFYDGQHRFYCGVDLHTKRMYLCILDCDGNKVLHRNLRAKLDDFLNAIKPFRDDLVVGVECMYTWYWLADLCLEVGIKFLLGHALCRKAIHGGKKMDDISPFSNSFRLLVQAGSEIVQNCARRPWE